MALLQIVLKEVGRHLVGYLPQEEPIGGVVGSVSRSHHYEG